MRSKLWSPAVWPVIGFVVLAVSLSAANAPVELGVKGRGNATPTIAADGSFVAVAWGGAQPSGTTDVFTAVSRDGGRAFGAPVRVNNVEGDARLNGEQPPHVALVPRAGREPAIVVVWTTKGANGTKLLQSRSDDGGKSFSPGALVPGTDAAGNRGWEAIAVEPGGRVDAVWLDHRELAKDSSMATSHHEHAGAEQAGRRRDGAAVEAVLRVARRDGGAARGDRRRLLLLQDGARRRRRRSDLRGVAPRLSGQPARHGVHASRATAAARSRRPSASAKTSGCSKAVRTMGRRWWWTRRSASTSCGRR